MCALLTHFRMQWGGWGMVTFPSLREGPEDLLAGTYPSSFYDVA